MSNSPLKLPKSPSYGVKDTIDESILFSRDSENWIKTVIIGVVLLSFSYLVIPALIYMGYLVSVLRNAARGSDEFASFDDWMMLFSDGVRAFMIGIYYLLNRANILLALVALYLGIPIDKILSFIQSISKDALTAFPRRIISILLAEGTLSEKIGGVIAEVTGLGAGAYVAIVALLIAMYIIPAALTRYAVSDDRTIRTGFELQAMAPVLVDPRYVLGWMLVMVLFLINWLVVSLPAQIPDLALTNISTSQSRLVETAAC